MNSQVARAVVVTGVSSGIGESIVRQLLDSGFRVFGSVRKEVDAQRLRDCLGSMFEPMIFDVRDNEAIKKAAQKVSESLDGHSLSALVNNAGLAAFGAMECLDNQEFDKVIAVNLQGTRYVTNAFLPLLRVRLSSNVEVGLMEPGKIINVSSLSGILNTPMNGAYCVSKHALESLSEIYRRELRSEGIKVFSIRSGPIQSKIWEKNTQVMPVYKNPHYQQMNLNAQDIIRNESAKALPTEAMAVLVQDIINNRKRKLAYEIGAGAGLATVLSSWVPTRMADWLIHRALSKST